MAHFIPSEQHDRHAFIESTIDTYLSVLDRNVKEAGYIDPTVALRHIVHAGNLVVPNLENSRIKLGKIALQNEDYIPIWAADVGEEVFASDNFTVPSPSQENRIRQALAEKSLSSEILDDLRLRSQQEQQPLRLDHSTTAATVLDNPVIYGTKDTGSFLHIQGRPFVLFNMNGYRNKKRNAHALITPPAIVHHEFVHISQSLDNPVHTMHTMGDFQDYMLISEIEAYLHETTAAAELQRQQVDRYLPTRSDRALFKAIRKFAEDHSLAGPEYAMTLQNSSIQSLRSHKLAQFIISSPILNEKQRRQPFDWSQID